MSRRSATSLFVDTSAFYARFVENAPRHEAAQSVFDGIRAGTLPYRPLVTSGYVLSELATLVLRKASHEVASDILKQIRASEGITVIHPDESSFEAICRSFDRFDEQQISFVDHSTAVAARHRDVEHVFTFDDDFKTLGFTVVPDDTGDV